MLSRSIARVSVAALALLVGSTTALAQVGTAITYQGQLKDGGLAKNTPVDLEFRLFNAASGGTQVGSTVTATLTPTDGLFTSSLDFGVNPYTSDTPSFLEIKVRDSGPGAFGTLPRVRLTASPYSLATRGITVGSAGNVAIGPTVSGITKLRVTGGLDIDSNGANDGLPNAGNGGLNANALFLGGTGSGEGLGSTRTAGGTNQGGVDIFTNFARRLSITPAGNVGIGTTTPGNKLSVAGAADMTGLAVLGTTDLVGRVGINQRFNNVSCNIKLIPGDASVLNVTDGTNQFFSIPAGGNTIVNNNLGVGTSNPTQRLHVIGNILATGTITPSCAKLKEHVVPMSDALDRLASLDAVRFDWKPEEAKIRGFTHDLGFIAENVAQAFPEVVFRDEKGEIAGLDYSRMSAVAVGAIKQLKSENDKMKADNADLKARLEKIEALLAAQAAAAK